MKIVLSILILGFLCGCAVNAESTNNFPLFVASNLKLENIGNFVFLNENEFVEMMSQDFLIKTLNLPTKVIMYTVSTPYDSKNTLDFIKDNEKKMEKFHKIFTHPEQSYSTQYMSHSIDSLQKLFYQQYENRKAFFKNITHSFEELLFESDHSRIREKSEPFVETVYVPFSALYELEKTLSTDMKELKKSGQNFVVMVLFRHHNPVEYQFVEKHSKTRILQQANNQTDVKNIGINANTLSGYLISLIIIATIYVGTMALMSLNTPEKFARLPLIVGRES